MEKKTKPQLTEVELQILGILWELGPSPVRDIHARLEAGKGTNYSTTVKMLSVMLRKGLLSRTENERPHVYRAKVSRKNAGKRMMKNLIDRVYEGSAMSLVLQVLASEKPKKGEIAEVRRLLDELENRS
jgi:predicted transcriptional regulator